MRKEIEVKAKLSDVRGVLRKLKALGCVLTEPATQHDTIFVDENYGAFEEFHPGRNVLRIRESKGKFLFTLKQPQSNELDCLEHETEVSDPVEFRHALELMGYHAAVEVHKTRMKTRYNGWEICVDHVVTLGDFIEVESIIEDDVDVDKIQNKLFAFLKTLGVRAQDQVTHGYDTLTYLKQQNK